MHFTLVSFSFPIHLGKEKGKSFSVFNWVPEPENSQKYQYSIPSPPPSCPWAGLSRVFLTYRPFPLSFQQFINYNSVFPNQAGLCFHVNSCLWVTSLVSCDSLCLLVFAIWGQCFAMRPHFSEECKKSFDFSICLVLFVVRREQQLLSSLKCWSVNCKSIPIFFNYLFF